PRERAGLVTWRLRHENGIARSQNFDYIIEVISQLGLSAASYARFVRAGGNFRREFRDGDGGVSERLAGAFGCRRRGTSRGVGGDTAGMRGVRGLRGGGDRGNPGGCRGIRRVAFPLGYP